MEKIFKNVLKRSREFRSRKFLSIGRWMLDHGLSANLMTSFSLIFGLLSIYYLFANYMLFVVFALLHLLADSLDGVVARAGHPTAFGEYFDKSTDDIVTILAVIKIGVYLSDNYAYIAAALFFLVQVIHLLSDLTVPTMSLRTMTLLPLIIYVPALWPQTVYLLTIIYLICGSAGAYLLVRQLQYFLTRTIVK